MKRRSVGESEDEEDVESECWHQLLMSGPEEISCEDVKEEDYCGPGLDNTRLFMRLTAGAGTRCMSLLSSSPNLTLPHNISRSPSSACSYVSSHLRFTHLLYLLHGLLVTSPASLLYRFALQVH